VDTGLQRVIEILRSIPTFPLDGAAAARPKNGTGGFWECRSTSPATLILSLSAGPSWLRVVRGRFL